MWPGLRVAMRGVSASSSPPDCRPAGFSYGFCTLPGSGYDRTLPTCAVAKSASLYLSGGCNEGRCPPLGIVILGGRRVFLHRASECSRGLWNHRPALTGSRKGFSGRETLLAEASATPWTRRGRQGSGMAMSAACCAGRHALRYLFLLRSYMRLSQRLSRSSRCSPSREQARP